MIGSPRTRKLGKKNLQKQRNEEKNKFSRVKKRGAGDCCDADQTDKASDTSASPERLFSSVGLVKSDLRGSLLDTTLIDVMWAKQAP